VPLNHVCLPFVVFQNLHVSPETRITKQNGENLSHQNCVTPQHLGCSILTYAIERKSKKSHDPNIKAFTTPNTSPQQQRMLLLLGHGVGFVCFGDYLSLEAH
jgi:hypothetical protein